MLRSSSVSGDGLRKQKEPRLGTDIAGTVEAVGSSVTQFEPGDEVFGACPGGFADWVCSWRQTGVEAAIIRLMGLPLPGPAITALQGLRDSRRVHAGQRLRLMVHPVAWVRLHPDCKVVRDGSHWGVQHAESGDGDTRQTTSSTTPGRFPQLSGSAMTDV